MKHAIKRAARRTKGARNVRPTQTKISITRAGRNGTRRRRRRSGRRRRRIERRPP